MFYDYACKKCKKQFEVSHGMNEKPQIICPDCKEDCQKVFSANGIIFKGSGWYVTDSSATKSSSSTNKEE